jgi:putative hemolysin
MTEPAATSTEAAVQPAQNVTETASTITTTAEMTPAMESGAGITSSTEASGTASAGLANPASQNCVAQGGTLSIETRGDGGQFGVCTFEDNRQCEEWALFRGQCPVGGLKVTGYLTPAARYCAITGGSYADNGTTGADDEKGVCTFTDGKSCPAADYYNGTCTP